MPTKILVADDSVTMRRVLEMTFAGEGATVVTVDSADAALNKAGEFAPDLIFADASLPNVDGYELARRIKTNPQLSKIAVVVMASQQSPYDEAKGRAVGADDHISKPFDTQAVIERVGQVLAKPRNLPAGQQDAAKPQQPSTTARSAPGTNGPATGTTRLPQGTRMGMGAPIPMQAPGKPPPLAPQPVASARPNPPAPMPAPASAKAAPSMPMPQAQAPMAQAPMAQAQAVQIQPPAPVAQAARPIASAAVQVASQDLGAKLAHLGLTREQIEGVLALSREVIEQVVWEVVPDLAEQLIKEEIRRLTAE